jgi:opacity protein-like surface antigen
MRKFVVTAVAAISALAFVATAAASALPANQVLHFQGAGSHVWNVKGGDSPHDTNTKALRLHVGDPSTGGYVVAYSKRSIHIATDAEAVANLSFEYKETTHVGAGAPRISVEFQNGDVAYLSASYCNHPIGSDWGRADFTRFKTNCSIWVAGVQYAADGTRSAWRVYTDANPDQIVEQAYLVADESGSYRIDSLSLGAGAMYTAGNTVGKVCTTDEASC